MEVTEKKLPVLPPGYVSLKDLKERWLKKKEREMREKEEEERDRERREKTEEEERERKRREKVKEEEAVLKMQSEESVAMTVILPPPGRPDRRRRKKKKEKRGNEEGERTSGSNGKIIKSKKEEEETLGGTAEMTVKEERETGVVNGRVWAKKKVVSVVDQMAEVERKFGEVSVRDTKGGRGNGGRRENRNRQGDRMAVIGPEIGKARGDWTVKKYLHYDPMAENEGRVGEEAKTVGNGQKDVRKSVVGNPTAENGGRDGDVLSDKKKGGKTKSFRKSSKGDRTAEIWQRSQGSLMVVGKGGDVREVMKDLQSDLTAGNEGEEISDLSTGDLMAENGQSDARKSVLGENGVGMGDAASYKEKGRGSRDLGKKVKGDRTAEIRKGGFGTRLRGLGKANWGKTRKAVDSSLVWVRKEDKSDVCVAGNCCEGVLEKAGEKEKKPGQARP